MRFRLALFAAVLLVFARGASAQTVAIDQTAAFIEAGAVIADLKVIQISDIVVIRGNTSSRARAEQVSRIATDLGHLRVANLIAIRDDVTEDAAIVYTGRRRLELERQLDGCSFLIQSERGVVRLTGSARNQAQIELAVAILSRIDGVSIVDARAARFVQ